LIVTTGTERRKIGVPGEEEYLGRGVSYCTNCDAPFFKNKKVAVVGGGDAAVSGAVHLAGFADKIYLIHRRDQFRAEPIWVEDVLSNDKIETLYDTRILEILGDGNKVIGIKVDKTFDSSDEIPVDAVFVEIGGIPESGLLPNLRVALDENNFVITSPRMETNVPGLFAAGDFTTQGLIMSQAITACAQGAIAAASAFKFIKNKSAPRI
ncbi:FAD-dependent oxidoreductase, partial [Patescibacteria group bacterium]|nr:FAD-dependent oxidoreductase [Patescibacteria group bacterium]